MSSNILSELLKNNNSIQNCRITTKNFPNLSPIISNITPITSKTNNYTVVYINVINFFPNGVTRINFGNYKNIRINFFSSFNISFVVPYNISTGIYKITAVNYFDTFPIQNIYYSNSFEYLLT